MAEGKMVGLPIAVASPVDLGRLIREIDSIDSTLSQEALRSGAQPTALPKLSELLTQTVELNKLNLLNPSDRKLLIQFLMSIREKAPRLHMSFSADPSTQFSAKLTSWLRENIHPLVLITFGLQPNIGAGTVVRTTNKYFDFSLGQALAKNRTMLMAQLREAIAQQKTEAAQPVVEPAEVPS
jgi:hypothetical protein